MKPFKSCWVALGLLLAVGVSSRAQFGPDSCLKATDAPVLAGGTNGLQSIVAGDLNGDDAVDVVTASLNDDRITWFESSRDPAGPADQEFSFMPHTVSTDADGATSVVLADLDGDCDAGNSGGCLDIVSASSNDNRIVWYRNDGIDPPKFTEIEISASARLAQDVFVADVNGDDLPDVLSASFEDNKIAWYMNDGQTPVPRFVEQDPITLNASGASAVFAIDMNRDGLVDVVSASVRDNKIAWYQSDGQMPAPGFTERVITSDDSMNGSTVDIPTAIFVAEIDGDDWPDVVVASNGNGADSGKILWYQSQNGVNAGDVPTFVPREIVTSLANARDVKVRDLNGDQFVDVIAAHGNAVAWYQNDGTPEEPGDGDWMMHVVSDTATGAESVFVSDLDADDVPDVQSAASAPGMLAMDDKAAWYRNDPAGTFTEQEPPITINSASPESIVAADINADGLLDVVSASSVDDTISWSQNDGLVPRSFTRQVIATNADGALSVAVGDLNGDCPPEAPTAGGPAPCRDVVSASPGDGKTGKIAWYANGGQSPVPGWTESVILQGSDLDPLMYAEPVSVFAADVNGDGFTDVVSAVRVNDEPASEEDDDLPDRISWWRNDGLADPTFAEQIVSTDADGPRWVFAADVDKDGDIDLFSASTNDDKIAMYENLGGDSPSFSEVVISTGAFGAMSVHVTDLDGDCPSTPAVPCMEVLSASADDDKIAWYDIVTEAPAEPEPVRSVAGTGWGVLPDALQFGNEYLNRTTPLSPLEVAITNNGGEALLVESITSSLPEFVPSPTELMIAGGATGSVFVEFKPSSAQSFDGTLVIHTDDPDQPMTEVALSGVGLGFVEHVITTEAFFARQVSSGDVDNDGLTDVLSASGGNSQIATYIQQPESDPLTFTPLTVSNLANEARVAIAADLNGDGNEDVVSAFYFAVTWYEGGLEETCNSFDADADQRMAGAELGWIWVGFGEMSDTEQWWSRVDFNEDGMIDGDDLAIGTSSGVWTKYVVPGEAEEPLGPVCNYTCVTQGSTDAP